MLPAGRHCRSQAMLTWRGVVPQCDLLLALELMKPGSIRPETSLREKVLPLTCQVTKITKMRIEAGWRWFAF